MENLSDEKLIELILSGKKNAFGVLIDRYEEKILRYARKFLFDTNKAEDLTQEVFIKVYVNIASFDLNKRFSPWIYRIAHNCFINEIIKNKQQPLLIIDTDVFLPQLIFKETPENNLLDKEFKEHIENCLQKINIKHREVLIVHYLEGLSYQEISDILRIPSNVVGVRIYRAKKAIKNIINKDYE